MIEFQVRVQPGSSRPSVGGERDGALVVRVGARAVEGAATEEARRAVARALGVRAGAVRCVKGERSRVKAMAVDGDEAALAARLAALRGAGPDERLARGRRMPQA